VLVAPPVAWVAARNGLGLVHVDPARDLAMLALWAVVEELVFRGGVQAALLRLTKARVASLSMANLVTSVAFAAAHLWSHPPLAALAVLPVALLLGVAYEQGFPSRRDSVLPPLALHLYFDAVLYAASVVSSP
jgi:membrane protease YdiL (CAAX protease family)